ncbi:MAG: glycosyltransferase [Nannocystaceae bacterium]
MTPSLAVMQTLPDRAPLTSAPNRLRVGLVALGGLGGSSRVACELARGLVAHGHFAVLLSSADTWWAHDHLEGVDTLGMPVPRTPRAASPGWVEPLTESLVRAVLEHDLHVLNVHYCVGLAAAAIEARRRLAARGRRLRVCATLHGTDVTRFGVHSRQGPELSAVLRQCDAVTAVSGWLADEALRTLKLPERPMVITNGIDTSLFRPRARTRVAAVGGQRGRMVLCHASNFRAVKRPLDAIAVLERLRRDDIDAELWMVGDGPLVEEAQHRAEPLGDAVHFFPATSPATLAHMLGVVDMTVVTSSSESFGLFALESMACGVPVLGTRCGGLEEIFAADRSGQLAEALLAHVGDVEDLAARAGVVLRDPAAMQRLRQAALAVGRDAFPRQDQLRAYARVLTELTTEAAA